MTKPSGNTRRRRGSDDGGRIVQLPAKYAKKKQSRKPQTMVEFFTDNWIRVSVGAFISVIIAGLITNRVLKAPIDAVAYDLGTMMPFEGALAINRRLTDAEILFENQVYGPESLVLNEKTQKLYAGFRTGLIAEINMKEGKEKIGPAVRLAQGNQDCDGSYKTMPFCGRPLGIRLSPSGELLVADAYLGLFAINWEAEQVVKVVGAGELPTNDENAPPVRYLNDLDFLPDGRIIISESSTKFDDRDFILDILEHRPNGRLLIYEPVKKNLRVLKDGLYFPNGVQVSIEKGAGKNAPYRVLFSEMTKARVMQIWVPQDHYSTAPVKVVPLIENLPGYPDNIRLTKTGHLLIPIPTHRANEDKYFEGSPYLREFISKVVAPQALNQLAEYVSDSNGLVIKVSTETGQIIESYHDVTGKMNAVSIAIDDGRGRMLLGSDVNYHIGRAKL